MKVAKTVNLKCCHYKKKMVVTWPMVVIILQYMFLYNVAYVNYTSIKLGRRRKKGWKYRAILRKPKRFLEAAVNFPKMLDSIWAGRDIKQCWSDLFLPSPWDLSSVLQVQASENSTVKHQWCIKMAYQAKVINLKKRHRAPRTWNVIWH